jgi:hypothetical protein
VSRDSDIDVILADGEDTFTAGDVTVAVELFEHDAVMGESSQAAGVIGGVGYVLVRASLFPSLATNDPVTLNGTAYKVAQKMRIQDGRVLQVFLGD